jgi:hypothetical protein
MTYEWNDILIVGDSFCSDRSVKSDWPNIFASSLTGQLFHPTLQVRGEGFKGASWWSAREKLLAELEHRPVKVLVVCHTEPYRIPNDQGLGINTLSVETKIVATPPGVEKPSENFIKAARGYYEYIISEKYHLWAYQQWFNEIDQIILKNNVEKVIHFFCFRGFYTSHTFARGVTIETPLIDLQQYSALWKKNDTRNHFSPSHNLEFGDRLASIIKNYPGDGVRLNTKLIGK